tara:strand:+ start:226 stop:468 length:243 start_codon:yes stop_codon:yes gene_type:complete
LLGRRNRLYLRSGYLESVFSSACELIEAGPNDKKQKISINLSKVFICILIIDNADARSNKINLFCKQSAEKAILKEIFLY